MIASTQFGDGQRGATANDALARVPEYAVGGTEWVRLALHDRASHLVPAILSGQPYRIVNAVRAMAHAPTLQQVDAVAGAVCDSLLSEAYAARNSRLIASVADARAVIDTVSTELHGEAELSAVDAGRERDQVASFVRLVALQDAGIAERLDATGALAGRIAGAMKLIPQTILDIELAGRLADIGMIGVPASTRAKREIHTKRDHERLNRHTVQSETFVRSVPALARLAPIVRSHHERFDGLGYPDGRSGEDIPLESRIIAVAAAFVDLVTESQQTKAMAADDACSEIARHAGTDFDPAVIAVALRLLHFRRRTNRTA